MFGRKTDKQINKLIILIQNTMTEFTSGNLSIREARNEYKKLLDIYNKVEKGLKKDEGLNIVNGLCYYTNIENFSILSGIYDIKNSDILPVAYYGDSSLNSKTMATIMKNRGEIHSKRAVMIKPNGSNILHPIYIYPLFSDSKNRKIFASVSSSTFFSREKFYYSAKFIKALYSISRDNIHLLDLNYFREVSKEVEKIIEQNVDSDHYVEAIRYEFSLLEDIFDHMGMETLLDISDTFIKTLKNAYKGNSRCLAVSLHDYLVLTRRRRDDTKKSTRRSVDFIYKDINLPYRTIEFDIREKDSMYNIWEKLL